MKKHYCLPISGKREKLLGTKNWNRLEWREITMEDFYEGLKKELLSKREQLRSLTRQPKIQGDYYEALVRDFVDRFIDDSLSVKQVIYDHKGQKSREATYHLRKRKKPLSSGD